VWGTRPHTCPYCDGFEHRDERLAVLAAGARGEHLAVLLRQWSDNVVLLRPGAAPHVAGGGGAHRGGGFALALAPILMRVFCLKRAAAASAGDAGGQRDFAGRSRPRE